MVGVAAAFEARFLHGLPAIPAAASPSPRWQEVPAGAQGVL